MRAEGQGAALLPLLERAGYVGDVFTGVSAVFAYKTHLLTAPNLPRTRRRTWRSSQIVVFTGVSAVFVYKTPGTDLGHPGEGVCEGEDVLCQVAPDDFLQGAEEGGRPDGLHRLPASANKFLLGKSFVSR
jgi:hypothetical protein